MFNATATHNGGNKNFGNIAGCDEDDDDFLPSIYSYTVFDKNSDMKDSSKPLRRIYGEYEKDYDINYIHDNIVKIFEYEKGPKLATMEKKALTNPTKYRPKIKDIKKGRKEKEYYNTCYQYIEVYNKVKKVSNMRSLTAKEEKAKYKIVTKYIAMAGKYIGLNIICNNGDKNKCDNCSYDFTNYEKEDIISLYICPGCGLEKDYMVKCSYNTENIREVKNHSYENRENFIDALRRDQGLSVKWPPEEVYKLFDDYCIKCDYLTKEDVLGLPLDENGRKPGTDKQIIFNFLKKYKLSDYNGDANIIGHVYWGWTLPNYSNYMDKLIEDYDNLQVIYEEIKHNFFKGKKKSSLNIEFRKCKQLQLVGYPCSPDDFKIITTLDILQTYEEIWKTMITMAQERYPSKREYYVYHSLI